VKRAVLFGMILASAWAAGCGTKPAELGTRAPAADFTVTDLKGKTIQLSALKGTVVLLDFWATWCPPCRQEIPHFKALDAQYRGQGLEIIGVAMDEGGPAVVSAFVRNEGVTYPVAMGDSQLAQAYGGIRGLPTTFLIDRRGRIAKKYLGYQDKEVFEKEIKVLLAEPL
jgi:peroxiredoxin